MEMKLQSLISGLLCHSGLRFSFKISLFLVGSFPRSLFKMKNITYPCHLSCVLGGWGVERGFLLRVSSWPTIEEAALRAYDPQL